MGTLGAQTGITFDSASHAHEASSILTGTPSVGSETVSDSGGRGAITAEDLAFTSGFGQAFASDLFAEFGTVNGQSVVLGETRASAVARDEIRLTPPASPEDEEFSLQLSSVVTMIGQREQNLSGSLSDVPVEAGATAAVTIRFSLTTEARLNLDLNAVRFDRLTDLGNANPLSGQPISAFGNQNAFSLAGSTEVRFTRVGGEKLDELTFFDSSLQTPRGELAGINSDLLLQAGQYELSLRTIAVGDWTLPAVEGEASIGFEYTLSASAVLTFHATPNLWEGNLGETAGFQNDAKWSKGSVPAADQSVNLGAGFSTITTSEDLSHARLVSELGGAHEFALGSHTLTLTDATDALRISEGVVGFANGGVQAGGTSIDGGKLLLGAGATFVGTDFSVSGNGQARLTAGADATVTSLRIAPGDPAGGGGLFLSGAGTTFHSTDGGSIRGNVDVGAGALLSFGDNAFVILGDIETASPVLLVADGSGTEIALGTTATFSVLRGAQIVVRNGATLSTGSREAGFQIVGGEADFFSRATLGETGVKLGGELGVGTNAVVTTDSLLVEGDSTAAIRDGGQLETFLLELGSRTDGSHGDVTVSGAGTRLTVKQRLNIDPEASGLVSVSDGAKLDFRTGLIHLAGNERQGILEAKGAGTTVTGGDYLVQTGGVIHVSDGASLSAAADSSSEIIGGGAFFSGNARGSFAALELSEGASLALTDSSQVSATSLVVTNSSVTVSVSSRLVSPTISIGNGGTLGGGGIVQGNIALEGGAIRPGNSPGLLTIEGDLTLNGGRIVMEIAGSTAGVEHDRLVVTGNVDLSGGSIELAFIDGFAPTTGQVFDLFGVTGSFDGDADFRVSGLEEGWQFETGFDPETGGFSLTALSNGIAAVPEPGTIMLTVLGLVGLFALARRTRRNP